MQAMEMKNVLTYLGVVAAVLVGIVFFIIMLKKKLKRQGDLSTNPSGYMMAKAMESVLKGQPNIEALGKLVFDALRFGNYRAYRGAFATLKEIQTLFAADKAAAIIKQLQDEARLKALFEQMRTDFYRNRGDYSGIEFQREIPLTGVDGKHHSTILEESFITVGVGDPPALIHLGTLVRGTFGWKLLLPKGNARLGS